MRIIIPFNFMFLPLLFFPYLLLPLLNAEPEPPPPASATYSARSLDALLQDSAFKALAMPRTGIPYDGHVPNNLTGIKVSAVRLRSGSLRTRGVSSYKEFHIPPGVVEQPYVERLVLVYHDLGNWSSIYYPLPGYTYVAPVLGLLAYSGTNLSAKDLPELNIRASNEPILIKFPDLEPNAGESSAKCVNFDLNGSVQFDIPLPGNVCPTIQQGHFSMVVESIASPSPAPAPSIHNPNPGARNGGSGGKGNSIVWILLGALGGGCVLLVLMGLMVVFLKRHRQRKRIQQMEWVADSNEALQVASLGNNTKAPLAAGTRTRPVLENEYLP